MFTDEHRYEVWEEIRQHDIRAFGSKLTPAVIAEAAARTGLKLVKRPLCLGNLAWLGIATALHIGVDFATVLTKTLQLLEDQQEFYSSKLGKEKKEGRHSEKKKSTESKHHPKRNDPTQLSEEAFVKARRRIPLSFWINLIIVLGEQFQEQHRSLLTFRGFRLLAMDGTCIDMANWKRLKAHFGTASNANGKQHAQARMVMLQFPLARLPYRYELCPLDNGEVRMRSSPRETLVQERFGTVGRLFLELRPLLGYPESWGVLRGGLEKEKDQLEARPFFGPARPVDVLETERQSRAMEKEKLPKSIELRVITYRIPGFRAQKLVTNVRNEARIPREDWVRLASDCTENGQFKPGLYHRRWEIETTYRELKVEQGKNGNLRSRSPESIKLEVRAMSSCTSWCVG